MTNERIAGIEILNDAWLQEVKAMALVGDESSTDTLKLIESYLDVSAALRRYARLIGHPAPGMHLDEWGPRALTWHEERKNWHDEVERLRAHIDQLEGRAR